MAEPLWLEGDYPVGRDFYDLLTGRTQYFGYDEEGKPDRDPLAGMARSGDRSTLARFFGWNPNNPGSGAGIGDAVLNGLTLGGGDEVTAAVNTGLRRGINYVSGRPEVSTPDQDYERDLATARTDYDDWSGRYPVSSIVGEMYGGLPYMFIPGIGPVAISSRIGQYLRAAGIGAGFGGAYGFNSGEGSAGRRAEDAGVMGSIGAALNVLPLGLGDLVRKFRGTRRIPLRLDTNPELPAPVRRIDYSPAE